MDGDTVKHLRQQFGEIASVGLGIVLLGVGWFVAPDRIVASGVIGCGVLMIGFGFYRAGLLPLPTGKITLSKAGQRLYNGSGKDIRELARIFARILGDHLPEGEAIVEYGRQQALDAAKRDIIRLYGRRGAGLVREPMKRDEFEHAVLGPNDTVAHNYGNPDVQFSDVRMPAWQIARLRRAILDGKLIGRP